MDFIKPMINTVILGIFILTLFYYFLLIFSVLMFICILLILSVYFSSCFSCYFSFIISAFVHHIFIPIALCIYSLFYLFLFSLLFTSSFHFFSWWTHLTCVLTVFSLNLRQESIYFTFVRSRWLHQCYYVFKFQYNHDCSPVFALQMLIQDLQLVLIRI